MPSKRRERRESRKIKNKKKDRKKNRTRRTKGSDDIPEEESKESSNYIEESKTTSNYIEEFVQNPHNMDFNGMMQMIVDEIVNIDVKDPTYHNYTALMYNVEQSNLAIVSELLDIGADPNIQDKNKETALFKVLTMKDPTDAPLFISLLLKRGADKTIKNKKGLTAYNVAISNYNYNPNDLPALLLKPNGHIKPEFVDEILKPTKYEKDLYKYLSSSSDESTSPKMHYEELLKRNKITTVASSVNDLFKIHIENPKEIFENYRNLSYSGNNIDCAYQSLFALGLIGQSAAKKGSKSSILVKRHYSDKIMGVSLPSIKKHIISMFELKPDDIIEYSFAPKTLVLINLDVYLKAYLDNNTCTIILIEFGSNNIGHFCVVFKQDDRVFVFDPQFTGKEEFPVFPLLQINKFYSQTHNKPMELTEYSVFLFKNPVPAKPIRRDYCSYNLPLFVK
jgi:hypothetical protein